MKHLLLILLLFSSFSFSQDIRREAMGGLSFSIIDKDYQLNPYDLSGNPAWLNNDETTDYLEIKPNLSFTSGSYKRDYDPSEKYNYGATVEGVRNLKNGNTFLGRTTYQFDKRIGVNRTLEYNTYAGDAFFIQDTTKGDFLFNGPKVEFMYSFNVLDDLFVGLSAGYGITTGLKNIYSRSETVYRNVSGGIGVAYQLSNKSVIGINAGIIDDQEKIEVESDDLLDVEVFRFKGDTYSVKKRSGSVSQKNHMQDLFIGGQFTVNPTEKMEMAVTGKITDGESSLLIPYTITSTDESLKEYEDGYASFTSYDLSFIIREWSINNIMFSAKADYKLDKSWSKNSGLNLLLWEWETELLSVGAGVSYNLGNSNTIAAEYGLSFGSQDSLKYVDSRFSCMEFITNSIKLGGEFGISDDVSLRVGYNYWLANLDGEAENENGDVDAQKYTLGMGYSIKDILRLEFITSYGIINPTSDNSRTRENLSVALMATLYKFSTF